MGVGGRTSEVVLSDRSGQPLIELSEDGLTLNFYGRLPVGGVDKASIGLGLVENTALSTWPGSVNLVTLGPLATGLELLAVSTPLAGNIFKGANRWAHNYAAPGSNGLNTFVGLLAGNFTMSPAGGNSNLASTNAGFGHLSLNALTTGRDNSGFGKGTLYNTTSGELNTALGTDALAANTIGSMNTAVGVDALYRNISGNENVAVGENALVFATTPTGNTAIGFSALFAVSTGAANVALGRSAGGLITTGANNVFLGHGAGLLQADNATPLANASNSIYVGKDARGFDDADVNAIVIGYNAIGRGPNKAVIGNAAVTDVYFGTGLGTATLRALALVAGGASVTATGMNVASGLAYQYNNITVIRAQTALANYAFGNSGNLTGTGANNTSLGQNALTLNTTGANNLALGTSALAANTTGDNNVAIGVQTLNANIGGISNIAIGTTALKLNTTGLNNVAIGELVLTTNLTGTQNVGIGISALQLSLLSFNTAVGYSALASLTGVGERNTAVGRTAGNSLTTGTLNSFLGFGAGSNASQKVDAINSMALGNATYTTADHQVVIGNVSVTEVYFGSVTAAAKVHALLFQTHTAIVAAGGGAAPTFTTIGGSGPVVAAQNGWMKMLDAAGAACYVPVWK